MVYNKFADEEWHYCRNPRCRTKLPTSVSNKREAFCTRGCFNSFYLHRCLICDRSIEQPKRGKRLICKRVKCRKDLRNKFCLGRYHTSSAAKLISKEADFIGLKGRVKPDRPWRIVAGPELGASAFHCAAVGGEEAVGAINRTNLKRWHEANARAEGKTLIKRHYPPVNVPGAPLVDLAPSETSDIPQAKARLSDDQLDIPNFLRRTARPPETLAAQNSPPQAVHLRKTRVKVEG